MPAEALQVFDCELSGLSLIEASAGTGKTWNICALYMRLLLQRGLTVPQILVVTFTNAATAELRERIRSRIAETLGHLRGAAVNANDAFVADLLHTLRARHGRADADMERHLEHALQTFDEAAIFTIHGFCERALRDTPFGAGMPLSMELLTDDAPLRLEVACDFWRRSVAGGALVAGLAGLLVGKRDTPEKFAKQLQRQAARPLARELWPEGIGAPVPIDVSALQRAFVAARTSWQRDRDTIIAHVDEARGRLHARLYTRESIDTAAADWNALLAADAALEAPQGLAKLSLFTRERLRPNKGRAPPADHEFFDLAGILLVRLDEVRSALGLGRLQLLHGLLRDGPPALRAAKLAQRVMSFDDLLGNLHQRLTGGHFPWLAGLLQARFPAALIDEFQDTDPLQFSIFQRIYASADSCADAALFLVGDPKQAIYSFRHADLHVYLRARREATRIYTLVENQRCTRSLLDGLNALFGTRAAVFRLEGLEYVPLLYGRKPRVALSDATSARAPLQLWTLPRGVDGAPLAKREARRCAAMACASEIARLLAAAGQGDITLDGARLSAGHIAVLVRKHDEGTQMREALAACGVGSVELSQQDIFASAEAGELERVLAAMLEPMRVPLVRAALATTLLGGDAALIEELSADDGDILDSMMQFAACRDAWLRDGVGRMLRRFMVQQRIGERLLSLPLGRRRLTNFLHLGELLQAADARHATPEVLLRWLQSRIAEDPQGEESQLRLDSDRDLVQIITIHKAKGLEYPFVFCPFLWDGHAGRSQAATEGLEYHDDADLQVIDFRTLSDADASRIRQQITAERTAERLRLIYVALTRAVHRCYLVIGSYTRGTAHGVSATESHHAPLNQLVCADCETAEQIDAAWSALAQRGAPGIGIAPLPPDTVQSVPWQRPAPETLAIPAPPSHIPSGWRLGSYSQLIHGASGEAAAVDHDLRVTVSAGVGPDVPDAVAPTDIVRFPRGLTAGHCIHAVFEAVDFTRPNDWSTAIEAALRAHPQSARDASATAQLPAMLANMLQDVLHTPLGEGFRLAEVPRARRLVELRFSVPVSRVTHQGLKRTLEQHGLPMPGLSFAALHGYLNGAIDLVIEAAGRYWILDWKSNYLGATAAHYEGPALQHAMDEHYYHLQYLLYTVALHRYLRRRMPGYRYAEHFGGALYLFVRGVRPTWIARDGTAAGVYARRPAQALIESLSALLEPARGAA